MNAFRAGPRSGKAVLSILLLALAGCGGGGGGGGGSTTPPPSGNPNPNPPALSRLTLTGMVNDAPIANAVVTATVNGQTFTATADANGNYSLQISVTESATNSFVTLTARGAGPQSHIEFTSLLGTFASLKTQAGSDETLSSTENFATQITNVSTAMAVLLQQANGGNPVTSATLLQTLTTSLNSEELLDLAAGIKLLVDEAGDYPMPDGHSSLRTLLADTAAREQFVTAAQEQNPSMFDAMRTAIVNDATLTQPVTAATLPATLVTAHLPKKVESNQDRVVTYQFNADGTGTASARSWRTDMTWSISGPRVAIAYSAPVNVRGREISSCPQILGFGYGNRHLPIRYRVDGATLTLLSDRVIAVTEDRFITYRVCGPEAQTESVTVARTIVDQQSAQPIDAAELRDSTRTLWVYDEFSESFADDNTVLPDIAELRADGTGSTRMFGKQFTWQLDASGRVLTATFEDGTVARYSSLRDLDDVTTDMLYDVSLPSGGRSVGAGISVHVDLQRPLDFTAENVIGRYYYSGLGPDIGLPGDKGYRLRFDADGTGSHEDELLDEQGNIHVWDVTEIDYWGYFWRLDGTDLVVQHTQGMDDLYPFNCSIGTLYCNIYDERRYVPLVRSGNRIYWLEYNRFSQGSVDDTSSRQTYVSFLEYEPPGASALTTEPARSFKPRAAVAPSFRRPPLLLPSQR